MKKNYSGIATITLLAILSIALLISGGYSAEVSLGSMSDSYEWTSDFNEAVEACDDSDCILCVWDLNEDCTANKSIDIDHTMTFEVNLNGHMITYTGGGPLFDINGEDVTLIINGGSGISHQVKYSACEAFEYSGGDSSGSVWGGVVYIPGDDGSAVMVDGDGADVDISNVTFVGGVARWGGFMRVPSYSEDCDIVISDCNIRYCCSWSKTFSYDGGAMLIGDSKVSMHRCVMERNHAGSEGSAICLEGGELLLDSCRIEQNFSKECGAVVKQYGGAKLTITGDTAIFNNYIGKAETFNGIQSNLIIEDIDSASEVKISLGPRGIVSITDTKCFKASDTTVKGIYVNDRCQSNGDFRTLCEIRNIGKTDADDVGVVGFCTVTGAYNDYYNVRIAVQGTGWANKLSLPGAMVQWCVSASVSDGVKNIPEGAFRDAQHLGGIRLGSGIEVIEKYAFVNSGITEITLSSKITKVAAEAFDGAKLKTVHIEGGAHGIDNNAFKGCTFEYGGQTIAQSELGNYPGTYVKNDQGVYAYKASDPLDTLLDDEGAGMIWIIVGAFVLIVLVLALLFIRKKRLGC